ncbi:hypothetical protein HPC49_46805 [Pyxidicoccus fallax]|uniref:Uncharacterized protein n=1 Tax=Pyxidicoccus fallax TaxID=394095 RepID=A0A848LN11_9BACT|nr:hypothetical protein [Pyxidicoccus fallax]NMO19235.1 hypothetical protein [Pyxidicoccus fallax]NPC85688.1 hypothetical protein [Pyxidicoccus fallax]
MTDLVIRRAWRKMKASEVEALFPSAWAFKEAHTPQAVYAVRTDFHASMKRPTMAESYGAWCREFFEVATLVLSEMRSHRDWVAFISHSTDHTSMNDPDCLELPEQEVVGQFLDPIVFDYPWVDNTLRPPGARPGPDDWVISLRPEDADDTHLFFDREGGRLILCDGPQSRWAFFGFAPPIPDRFSWLARV